MAKKVELPIFTEGTRVRLLRDIMWTPLQPNGQYGEERPFVTAGTEGTITGTLMGGNYPVSFGGFWLWVYPSRLEAVAVPITEFEVGRPRGASYGAWRK